MRKHCWVASKPLKPTLLSLIGAAMVAVLQCGCQSEHGGSSVELLEPIAPTTPKSDAKGEASAENIFVNPIPPSLIGSLAKPEYPAPALAAHAGECVVFATITIGPAGTVTEVVPSWQRVNIPNRFSEQFLDAVREAVRSWRFEPARDVYWEKDANGDLKYVRTETVPARVDIKFTFDSAGSVR
jgi:hypothetical protein